MINRFCFAFATTLLLGCGKAEQSTSQGKELNDPSICLDMLPSSVKLEGGSVIIGSNNAYPEERPERRAKVDSFEIDTHEVTNKQFSKFVEDTGYVSDAEKPQPGFDVPGGAVFSSPSAKSPSWWQFVEGANWQHPKDRIAQLRDGIWILLSR